jgi:DNA-binding MarR family transcriptional regulator
MSVWPPPVATLIWIWLQRQRATIYAPVGVSRLYAALTRLGVTRTSIHAQLDRLERAGLIACRRTPQGYRRTVWLTEEQ